MRERLEETSSTRLRARRRRRQESILQVTGSSMHAAAARHHVWVWVPGSWPCGMCIGRQLHHCEATPSKPSSHGKTRGWRHAGHCGERDNGTTECTHQPGDGTGPGRMEQSHTRPLIMQTIKRDHRHTHASYTQPGRPVSKQNEVRSGLYCTGCSDHICSVPSAFLPCLPIVSWTIASAHTMLSSSSDRTLYTPDPHCIRW